MNASAVFAVVPDRLGRPGFFAWKRNDVLQRGQNHRR